MDDSKDFFSYVKGETKVWWVDGYGKTPSEKTQQFIFLKPLLMQQFFQWVVEPSIWKISTSQILSSPHKLGLKLQKLKPPPTVDGWNPKYGTL